MSKRLTAVVCVALSFMFLFITVGYASFTDTMKLTGEAIAEPPEGLFIIDIVTQGTNDVDHQTVEFLPFTTTVDSTIDKKNSTTSSSGGGWWPGWGGGQTTTTYEGSVTYQITVLNNTKHEYAYRGLFYQTSLSGYNGNGNVKALNESNNTSIDNSKINVEVTFPNNYKIVGPGEKLTFTATYTVGKNMSDTTDWKTLLNFQFGINVESEEAARNAIFEKFLNILNTRSTYDTLVDAIDDKFDGQQEWTSNYIGNVSNAVDHDSYIVETLFAGQLNMIIDGETKPASVLIKHENLDWNNYTGDDYVAKNESNGGEFRGYGCEMTLYLTTDPLSTPNGNAPVYVAVFTCDRDENGNFISNWYRIGDTYAGQANIVGYNGESGGTGSFVTDNWTAYTATYSPTDEYSYTVASGTTIKTLVQVVDDNAIREFQRLLTESKEVIEDLRYAGVGIELIESCYEKASRYYTLDADGNPVTNAGTTRAQLLPTMIELNHAVSEAKDAIEGLPEH